MGITYKFTSKRAESKNLEKLLQSTLQMLYNVNNSIFFQLFPKEIQALSYSPEVKTKLGEELPPALLHFLVPTDWTRC